MAKRKLSPMQLPTPIASVKYRDTSKNITTDELRDFATADEKSPKTAV